MLEGSVSQQAQMEIARLGGLPQRNNVGACVDSTGRAVRYGLMNVSKQQNERIKSSDIIAPVPITITPEMVGQTFGVYCAFETKHSDWHMTPGDTHAQAQAEYHRVVRLHGGRAGFVRCVADVQRIILTGVGAW